MSTAPWVALALTCLLGPSIGAPTGGGVPRICIDPGHGGWDPGAQGFGLEEADVNLDVALRLAALLDADTLDESGGGAWDVMLTREAEVYVSLADRVAMANAWPADHFVSIHCNAFGDPAANGTETYSFAEGIEAAAVRDRIQERMIDAWDLTDRGSKTANFYVLRETVMPATLTEMGFITNSVDVLWLGSAQERQAAAVARLFALQEHHGFGVYLPFPPPSVRCEAKVNSLGCLPAIHWTGSPTLSGADDFHITASGVVSNQPGLLFWGREAQEVPFAGGSLCVRPPLVRQAAVHSGGGVTPSCAGVFHAVFSQAAMVSNGLVPGTTIHAQFWYRDPAHPDGTGIGMTDALEAVIGI